MLVIESPLHLRNTIEAALGDSIGTYTFSNGQKVKAIALLRGGEIYPPPETVTEGLEAVVFYPSPSIEPNLGGYTVRNDWIVHLKQWDVEKTTLPGTQKILQSVGCVIRSVKVPASKALGIPETMSLTLRNWEGVNYV